MDGTPMRKTKYFYLPLLVVLFGCSSTPQPAPTMLAPTPRNTVELPPTWTPTAAIPPSETPLQSPTLTFTPFPSVTPLPPTPTPGPTSDAPTPAATATLTPTIDATCSVSALAKGIRIHLAPFIDPYRVLPTLTPNTTYKATSLHPPYYELAQEGETLGWVDSRQMTLTAQGTGCTQLPTDSRAISDFPDLCIITPDGEVDTYLDRALVEPIQTITSTISSVALLKYPNVWLASTDESEPKFFIDADQVRQSGACEDVPTTGITTANGWLWSQPDGESGEHLMQLTPGYVVFIQEGPTVGVGPPSASQDGAWYFVLVSPPEVGRAGWVWSTQIFME